MENTDPPEQAEEPAQATDGSAGPAADTGGAGEPGRYPVFLKPAGIQEPLETGEPAEDAAPPAGRREALWSFLCSPGRRNLVLGGVAAGVAVLVIVIVTLWPGEGAGPVTGKIAGALEQADPVPRGPIITSVPPGCGVSAYTRDRLGLHGAQEQGPPADPHQRTCEWKMGVIAASLGGGNRELTITVTTHNSIPDALDRFTLEVDQRPHTASETTAGPTRTLSGLGDEALVWYQVDSRAPIYPGGKQPKGFPHTSHTTILFRQGNVVATVEYGGANYEAGRLHNPSKKEQVLPEASASDGALLAARNAATSMGMLADGAGRVGTLPKETSLIEEPIDVCALLPASALKLLGADGVAPRRRDTYLLPNVKGIEPQGCVLDTLEVSVLTVPGSRKGGAEPAAVRAYLEAHYFNRDLRGRDDKPRERFFHALNGPGDQAFVVFESDDTADAELIFRTRNVLVGVKYVSYGSGERNAMLNRVYTAAVEIAKALHG